MTDPRPDSARFPGAEPSSLDRQQRRPQFRSKDLRRAITLTEIGGLALLELVLWLAYRRRHLHWRVNGAIAKWENDFEHPRARRRGSKQARGTVGTRPQL